MQEIYCRKPNAVLQNREINRMQKGVRQR